jgi:hypothetical protein
LNVKEQKKISASQKMCKKIRHFDSSAILNLYKKKLWHKSCIFSQKTQKRKCFWKIIIFEIWKRRFHRHLEFSRLFEFLSLEFFLNFFPAQSHEENVYISSLKSKTNELTYLYGLLSQIKKYRSQNIVQLKIEKTIWSQTV